MRPYREETVGASFLESVSEAVPELSSGRKEDRIAALKLQRARNILLRESGWYHVRISRPYCREGVFLYA